MAYKKWVIADFDKRIAQNLAEECGVDPFLALIAASRGYTDPTEFEQLFSAEPVFSSPYELPDMQKAVECIKSAINDGKKIGVYGDFDCDGITATALLYDCLLKMGANVIYYIPDRIDEGYGMSVAAVDKLKEQGVDLIITVDNGISSIEEIAHANSLGIQTVVTDHHLPKEILPDAVAIVNPHRIDSGLEFKCICGVYVAYKLACALSDAECEQLLSQYADLVTIGLIADIMPLVNENRDMVKQGLYHINNTSRMGIVALLNSAGIKRGEVNASRIAFGIAPRINAAGRINDAYIAVKLLLTDDFHEASSLAAQLEEFNTQRHAIEQEITKQAMQKITRNGYDFDRVIVVDGEDWHRGVVGIVASKIADKYGKPTIVLSVDKDGDVSGSGRSIGDFSLYQAINNSSEYLDRFGGHDMAAGVGLKLENIEKFRLKINEYAKAVTYPVPILKLDCKLNPAALSLDFVETVKFLEPFGMGNPAPIFGLYGLTLQRVVSLSKDKHSKLLLNKNDSVVEVLAFGVAPDCVPFSIGDVIDIAVSLDVSEYGGRRSLSLTLKNWRKPNIEQDKLFKDICDYDEYKKGVQGNFTPPTREEIGEIYHSITQQPTAEALRQKHMCDLGYFKTMVSVDVLKELGIINEIYDKNVQRYNAVNGKTADLDSSKILKFLRGE